MTSQVFLVRGCVRLFITLRYPSRVQKGKLVLIIGPSGVGKSVLLKELKRRHPEFLYPRSATTRAKRPKESAELYHFVSEAVFTRWIKEGKFLEWAQVHKSARYGTLLSEIMPEIQQGKTVIREVDVQGFRSIHDHPFFHGGSAKNSQYCLQTIFIMPENERQLIAHITARAPISPEELQRRIESMREELACAKQTDHQIINEEGKLMQTYEKLEKIILKES